jgi:hypothetical protein
MFRAASRVFAARDEYARVSICTSEDDCCKVGEINYLYSLSLSFLLLHLHSMR